MIQQFIYDYFSALWELTNEMSPYLLLGFLFAGILNVYIKQETISKKLGKKNFKSILYASLIGIPLPLCSCGVIPTGISFHKNGASKGASVSFLISTPQTGIDSILVTYSMLGLPFAILRPIVALITGVAGGSLANMLDKKELQPQFQLAADAQTCNDSSCGCHDDTAKQKQSKMYRLFHYAFVEFMQDIAKWLIIGLLIAAFISALLPDTFFSEIISNPILSMLIVLIASVPLYICATSSVPIAAAMVMKGLSPGAALVFLMAGPATNAATMTVLGKSLGKKSLIAYLASIIGGALIFGFAIDLAFPADFFFSALSAHSHEHSILPEWFYWINSASLIILLANSLYLKYRNTKMDTPVFSLANEKTIEVHGMTCNHCKKNVETNLSKLDGIDEATVDLNSKTVTLKGTNIKLEAVATLINELGYDYKGEK